MTQRLDTCKIHGGLCGAILIAGFLVDAVRLPTAAEDVRVVNREQLVAAMQKAKPGTTILLASGKYVGGLSQRSLRGTKAKPIVVRSEQSSRPAVIEGGGSGLHLSSPEFVELRDIEFLAAEANGLNIDDGGDSKAPARGVKLIGLRVTNNSPRGNRDGMKLSGLVDFEVQNCTVERWGTSGSAIDMVGCRDGVVSGCTFRHSGADYANGVQTKGGSRDITIRRCRFQNAGGRAINIGGSTGLAYFRPKPEGFEARDITVEDCTIEGSMSPIAFVGVDGATVQHNTIVRPTRWALRILQENQGTDFVACRNGRFVKNLIAFQSDEVRTLVNVGGGTSPETFQFEKNWWFCLDRPEATRNLVQLPVRESGGTYGVDPGFKSPHNGDYTFANKQAIDAGVRTEK